MPVLYLVLSSHYYSNTHTSSHQRLQQSTVNYISEMSEEELEVIIYEAKGSIHVLDTYISPPPPLRQVRDVNLRKKERQMLAAWHAFSRTLPSTKVSS